MNAQTVINDATRRLSDMGHPGNDFTLAQMDAISAAIDAENRKAKELSFSKNDLVFKVDDVSVKVGQDIRVEVGFLDGEAMILVLTHEGIIVDTFKDGEPDMTASKTYGELHTEVNNGCF